MKPRIDLSRACLYLVLCSTSILGAKASFAEESSVARAARQKAQSVWYEGNPKAIAKMLTSDDVKAIAKDHESALRMMIHWNDAFSRLQLNQGSKSDWAKVLKGVETWTALLADQFEDELDDHRVALPKWASSEACLLLATFESKLNKSEEAWKVFSEAPQEISRTEGAGAWTRHGYNRAFELVARHFYREDANIYATMTGFIYLRTKMGFNRRAFSHFAIPVADAHRDYMEAFMALRKKSPDLDEARSKLEAALQKIATYRNDVSAPLSAVRLQNDVVNLVRTHPDLEMEASYDARSLVNLRESMLPNASSVEQTITFAIPYSSCWRVVLGRLAGSDVLHILRTEPDGSRAFEFTLCAVPHATKFKLPGSKKSLAGSAPKLIAAALARQTKKALGSKTKVRAPKIEPFSKAIKDGWVYETAGKREAERGVVGKGKTHTYIVRMRRTGSLSGAIPPDVALFLNRLSITK